MPYRTNDNSAGGGEIHSRMAQVMNWSLPIGSVFGIRVSLHLTFLVYVAFVLLSEGDLVWQLEMLGILFGSVLLHEFGHCFACRSVGGQANSVILWPLGGLAMCRPPHRPGAQFVTTAGGPLVNVVLAAIALAVLPMIEGHLPVSFNPFSPWAARPQTTAGEIIAIIFIVNYLLLLFNLALVFYPFDGGRMLQELLWMKVGYYRSMKIAVIVGMVGAGVVAIIGLLTNRMMLTFIALFGGSACYQQFMVLRQSDRFAFADEPAYEPVHAGPKRDGWWQRLGQRRADARRQKQAQRDQQIDRILDKVHRDGLGSLTTGERRLLKHATEQQRGQ